MSGSQPVRARQLFAMSPVPSMSPSPGQATASGDPGVPHGSTHPEVILIFSFSVDIRGHVLSTVGSWGEAGWELVHGLSFSPWHLGRWHLALLPGPGRLWEAAPDFTISHL